MLTRSEYWEIVFRLRTRKLHVNYR